MANKDAPNGAHPVDNLGGPITHKARLYDVDASNGTAIFPGDFVKLEADGNVAPAAATDELLGVCIGVQVTSPGEDFLSNDNLSTTEHPGFLAASTAGKVLVVDDPNVLFEIQTAGTITADDRGQNADIVAGAGSTTTGRSAHEVSATTGTGTAQLRLIDYKRSPDNDVTLANSRWIVKINEHMHVDTTGI
jgi:hypothetical protein